MDTSANAISLKDLVYKGIVEQICSGNLTPDNIITESQLISTFGVSKSPVREALIQLCAEGIIKNMPRQGYQVIPVSPKTVHDLTDLRMYLELSSLPNAMKNMTAEWLAEVKALNTRRHQEVANRTVWTAWNNNLDFHLRLVALAGNEQVTSAVQQAMNTCSRAYAQVYKSHEEIVAPTRTENQHDIIIRSLEYHDIFTAHEALKRDIQMLEFTLLSSTI